MTDNLMGRALPVRLRVGDGPEVLVAEVAPQVVYADAAGVRAALVRALRATADRLERMEVDG